MGFRFFRRIKIAPGITLNLSKSGPSLSFGPRGAKLTIGTTGVRTTFGLPGTGLYYTKKYSPSSRGKTSPGSQSSSAVLGEIPPEERLELGFFKRLIVPDDEEALVDGLRELTRGNQDGALKHLENALNFADGAFTAGFIALKKEDFERAINYLSFALKRKEELGRYFAKYGIHLEIQLPITKELVAHIEPNPRGVLLALAECYQRLGRLQEAETCLRGLIKLAPEDLVAKLSFAELLMERSPTDKKLCQELVQLLERIENHSELHTGLLLYKAKALQGLGLVNGAQELLTQLLRRTKDLSPELIKALRYERSLVYLASGQTRKARAEWEKLYAEDPDYEDVAKRLGLSS